MPSNKIKETGKSRFWRMTSGASLGHIVCEAYARHPRRKVEKAVGHVKMDVREEVQVGCIDNHNLRCLKS